MVRQCAAESFRNDGMMMDDDGICICLYGYVQYEDGMRRLGKSQQPIGVLKIQKLTTRRIVSLARPPLHWSLHPQKEKGT